MYEYILLMVWHTQHHHILYHEVETKQAYIYILAQIGMKNYQIGCRESRMPQSVWLQS